MLLPTLGETVNERYRIDAVLARGGMGVVYRATQLAVGREVAVKMVLAENQDNDRHLERFRREVNIAMRLKHPSIVEIYDFGQTHDGMNFIVMEFIEGEDLKALVNKTGAFSVGRTRTIIEQVLDALCAAHENRVIHRDLKPSNIMLTKVGRGRELPKILDFGIAKSVGEQTELTMSGEVLGSIPYLAPEGLRGEGITYGVDVYAIGLIILEMLTGSRVRQGPNTAQIVAQHLTKDVTIPDEIEGTLLAAFLRRACSRNPAERFPHAMAMYDELEAAFDSVDQNLVCEAQIVAQVEDPYSAFSNIDEAPTTATPSHSGGFDAPPTLLTPRDRTGTAEVVERLTLPMPRISEQMIAERRAESSSGTFTQSKPEPIPVFTPAAQTSSLPSKESSSKKMAVGIGIVALVLVGGLIFAFNGTPETEPTEEPGLAASEIPPQLPEPKIEPEPSVIESPPLAAPTEPEMAFDEDEEMVPTDSAPVVAEEPVVEEKPARIEKKEEPKTAKRAVLSPFDEDPVKVQNDSTSKKPANRDTQRRQDKKRQEKKDDPFSVGKF